MGDRDRDQEARRALLRRLRRELYDRPCDLCGKPTGRPRATMCKPCRKRAERRWKAGLLKEAYPGTSGLRGRIALDQLTKEEARALELEQGLARVRRTSYEAGRQDGIKEALTRVLPRLRRLWELEEERLHDGPSAPRGS